MEPLWSINSEIFLHPFTCLVAGPQQSGKTHLIQQILKYQDILISPPIKKIFYCYSVWQPKFDEMKQSINNLEFFQGIKSLEELNAFENNLIILDDLMQDCENSDCIAHLFTVDSHHRNCSVFFLSQNLFSRGKYMRTISLNCSYLIIFKNPRDKSQIGVLARQMFPDQIPFFMEAYSDAVENKSHSYLFLDLKQTTLEKNRIQSGIIPGEERIIYTKK